MPAGRRITAGPELAEVVINGYLMWGLLLPALLIVAGVITLQRKNRRRR